MTTQVSITVLILWAYPMISALTYYFVISDGLREEKEQGDRTWLSYVWRILFSVFPYVNMIVLLFRVLKASFDFNVDTKGYDSPSDQWSPFDKKYWKSLSVEDLHHYTNKEPVFNRSGGIDIKILAFPFAVVFYLIAYVVYGD